MSIRNSKHIQSFFLHKQSLLGGPIGGPIKEYYPKILFLNTFIELDGGGGVRLSFV